MAEMSGDLPVHPRTDQVAVGLLADGRPVWPVAGGSGPAGEPPADGGDDDADADDQDDAEGTEDDDSDDAGDHDEWTAPPKAKWDDLEAQKQRANREAARRRDEVKRLKAELEATRSAPRPADQKAAKDAATEREQAQQRVEAAEKRATAALRAAARKAILGAGYKSRPDGQTLVKIVESIDYSVLDFDERGELLGLDDQIDQIREEHEDLFGPLPGSEPPVPPRKKTPPRVNAGGGKPAPEKPPGWEHQLERQIKGGR